MNLVIKGVHYHISDTTKDFIEKKLHRLDFAKDYLVDLTVAVNKEPHGYQVDGKAHFRWGVLTIVEEEAHELYEAIEIMIDKLEKAVRKEKKKKIDKKGPHSKGEARLKEEIVGLNVEDQDDFLDEDEDEEEL